jgi:universal stress protein A
MTIYNRILVAVDSSDEAGQVLAAAAALPGASEADVRILHVAEHPDMAYGQWLIYLPIDEAQIQAKLLERLQSRVQAAGFAPETAAVEFGRPIDMIMATAQEQNCDLIVIGSHGRHGIRLVLGSTANAVLHRASCDVLAVRVQEEDASA